MLAGSKNFHVFELTRQLPRFSMYCRVDGQGVPVSPTKTATDKDNRAPSPDPLPAEGLLVTPKSSVHLQIRERPARIAMWVNQNFLLGEEIEATPEKDSVGGPGGNSPASER